MKLPIAASAAFSSTGVVATPVDVSGIVGDFTISVSMTALNATSGVPGVRVVLEESTNSFSTASPLAVFDFSGPVSAAGPKGQTVRAYTVNQTKIGTAGALIRANVYSLTNTTSGVMDVNINY